MAKLSKVCADAPEESHLHIVVQVLSPKPEFNLKCSVRKGDGVFSFKISKSGTVDGLKKAIKKEKEHAVHKVDTDHLNLWNVSIPDDQNLKENISKFK